MKKIDKKLLIMTSIVCLLPILIGLLYYSKLPDNIAIHWGVNNEPNGYLTKPLFVFGMPILMMIIEILSSIGNDVSDKNKEANKKTTTTFKWIIPILTMCLYIITIVYSLGNTINIGMIAMIIIGIVCIIIGNYVPKTKGMNYIRINKNIDEKTNGKLNKLYGYLLIVNGVLFILTSSLNYIIPVVMVVLFIIQMIVISVYIMIKFKQ